MNSNSDFREGSKSIYDAIQDIKSGVYIMPAFQRQYVWSMAQIEKLWDSITIGYPIAYFLFWKPNYGDVAPETYFCSFLTSVVYRNDRTLRNQNYDLMTMGSDRDYIAVLDGQQRLTSLFLSLLGEIRLRPKYAKNDDDAITANLYVELDEASVNLDEDEGDRVNYNSKRYDFNFIGENAPIPQTKFKIANLINDKFRNQESRMEAIEIILNNMPIGNRDYAARILQTLCSRIFDEKMIHYTELMNVSQSDALEIFVRFNSAGKPLSKAEITMSILEAYWPQARARFKDALTGPYAEYSTDFLIRSALMLYGNVDKTISQSVARTLRDDWEQFKAALKNMDELLSSMKISVARFAKSWNILIPILYAVRYNEDWREMAHAVKVYLVRATVFNYFQNSTTAKLMQLRHRMKNFSNRLSIELLDQIPELRVTDAKIDEVLSAEKGSRAATGALYYLSLDWLKDGVSYDQDHLHPYARFDGSVPSSIDPKDWMEWGRVRNCLPNLWYLRSSTNRSKSCDTLFEYYNSMDDENERKKFRQWALIPEGVSLELQDFGKFYEARKKLLKTKIEELICE